MLKFTPKDITRYGPGKATPELADYVGVYGTLRQGRGNHVLMDGAELVDTIRVEGLTMYCGGPRQVPFTVIDESNDTGVVLELYQPDDLMMRRLDRLEGHPTWYARTHITLPDGKVVCIYTVLKDDLYERHIKEDGDYFNWRDSHAA